jgi:hypothetical protein
MGSSSFWIVHRMAQASMPGDDLLFHCLSSSTIGAVGFHGRVRDGIGWDTDAMVTRQWSLCAWADNLGWFFNRCTFAGWLFIPPCVPLSGHQQR